MSSTKDSQINELKAQVEKEKEDLYNKTKLEVQHSTLNNKENNELKLKIQALEKQLVDQQTIEDLQTLNSSEMQSKEKQIEDLKVQIQQQIKENLQVEIQKKDVEGHNKQIQEQFNIVVRKLDEIKEENDQEITSIQQK